MDEARLSQRERRILAEIEQALSGDRPLDRTLRTMRRGRRIPGVPAVGVALLGAVTVTLLVAAVATGKAALIWAFATAWVITLVCLLRLVMRWASRVTAERRSRGTDRERNSAEDDPSAGA